MKRLLFFFAWVTVAAGCFGSRAVNQRFFVLHLPPNPVNVSRSIDGLVRVRNLDAESTYDKFQIVVRKNPFELSYRKTDVWAVKPNRMVSDLIARRLQETSLFSSVTRELGERRPDFTVGGDLHAIEIYDSEDRLYAHLAMTLSMTRFSTGEAMWTFTYDKRREVPTLRFSHAVRVLSELLDEATAEALTSMAALGTPRPGEDGPVEPEEPQAPPPTAIDQPILVPETPPEAG